MQQAGHLQHATVGSPSIPAGRTLYNAEDSELKSALGVSDQAFKVIKTALKIGVLKDGSWQPIVDIAQLQQLLGIGQSVLQSAQKSDLRVGAPNLDPHDVVMPCCKAALRAHQERVPIKLLGHQGPAPSCLRCHVALSCVNPCSRPACVLRFTLMANGTLHCAMQLYQQCLYSAGDLPADWWQQRKAFLELPAFLQLPSTTGSSQRHRPSPDDAPKTLYAATDKELGELDALGAGKLAALKTALAIGVHLDGQWQPVTERQHLRSMYFVGGKVEAAMDTAGFVIGTMLAEQPAHLAMTNYYVVKHDTLLYKLRPHWAARILTIGGRSAFVEPVGCQSDNEPLCSCLPQVTFVCRWSAC